MRADVLQPMLQALIDEAHRLNRKTACHAFGGDGLQFAITAGCDSIEHGYGLSQAQLTEMSKKGLYYDPTLMQYRAVHGRQRREEHRRQVSYDADLRERGVDGGQTPGLKIMVGSGVDGATFVHGTQALEFAGLVKRGMTTAAAIQSGTIVNAEAMGWKDSVGSVTKGKFADLVAVSGGPAGRYHRAAAREVRHEGRQGHSQ